MCHNQNRTNKVKKMRSILVTNSKGGSGKTTICTTLAGALVNQGYRVTLIDADLQGSAGEWLKRRSVYRPHIDYLKWDIASDKFPQCPRKTDFALIDSPSGIDTLHLMKHIAHCTILLFQSWQPFTIKSLQESFFIHSHVMRMHNHISQKFYQLDPE